MKDHPVGNTGTRTTTGAVGPAAGRYGAAPDGWPGGVSGGPVAWGVWAALCAAGCPATARQIADAVGTRRESANRALGQLERAGWARRERGDAKASIPDLWSPTVEAHGASVAASKSTADPSFSAEAEADEEEAPRAISALRARRTRMHAASSTPPADRRGFRCAALARLAAGELEEQVHELLLARPAEEFSTLQLARMLGGRSQGAVANACKRLVSKGEAVCSCQAPLRFTSVVQP